MKKAVMYGAGNIGRGFIGQLLSQSGYEVVFIDINEQVVDKLNLDRSYPIKYTSDEGNYEVIIESVRAVNSLDIVSVTKEISEAEVMATAVGVNVLSRIAEPIAKGLSERWNNKNMKPLNIIICENLIDASNYLKELVKKELKQEEYVKLDDLIGFVETSIGRMVPLMTTEMQEGNILRVCVEAYDQLPVDKNGFKGDIPEIKNLVPFSPFEYYIHSKLFVHNMGHAISAYLGFLKGYTFIWQAIGDEKIRFITHEAMLESARALSQEHGVELAIIQKHVDDLILRFANRQLGDTIERVGRDLQRKLAPNDRLVGALNLCTKNCIETRNISLGIAAALCFKDSMKSDVTNLLESNQPEEVLEKVSCISKDTKEFSSIMANYQVMNYEQKRA